MVRQTIQRKIVYDTVRRMRNHPSADEIFSEIRSEHKSISKATVYRNLRLLCDGGDILCVKVPNEADHFDFNCAPHYHFSCIRCGTVCDVDLEYKRELDEVILPGYALLGHNLTFLGLCPDCA